MSLIERSKELLQAVLLVTCVTLGWLPGSISAQTSGDAPGQSVAWQVHEQGKPGTIAGVVLATSGEPIRDAQVYLADASVGVVTGGDGRFELEPSAGGEWDLHVRMLGHHAISERIAVRDDLGVFAAVVMREVRIPLCGTVVCAGGSGCKDRNVRVLDSRTGRVPEVAVTLRVEYEDQVWEITAGPDSAAHPHGLGLGRPITTVGGHSIEITAPGYQAWRAEDIHLELPQDCHPVLRNRDHTARLLPVEP